MQHAEQWLLDSARISFRRRSGGGQHSFVMIWIVTLTLLIGTAANAQVYSLTPEEKAVTLEAASKRADVDSPALLPAFPNDRRAHGEVGAMIGTGGARGIYGIVGVPLGETGSARFAFSNTRLPGFYGYGPFGSRDVAQSSFGFSLRQPGW